MASLTTSKAREKILSKLRAGLQRATLPMPYPEVEHSVVAGAFTANEHEPEETFAMEFIKLGGKFIYCSDEQELIASLSDIHDRSGWGRMLCSEPALLQTFQQANLSFIEAADPAIENAEVCITGCAAMVARTGSFLFTSSQPMGRVASVFYPVHVVVAYASQLVPDIQEALQLMQSRYGTDGLPSMINLNTGPSRTADIEKTLVVGVHGPREVFCFFVND